MNTDQVYLDKHGVREIFPVSDATIWRLSKRPFDPFPAGKKIGGKRYRTRAETLDWLARQDTDQAPDQDPDEEAV